MQEGATRLPAYGTRGIDRGLDEFGLDAVVMPTYGPPFGIDPLNGDGQVMGSSAATTGYPAITVPIGYSLGLPAGLTFKGHTYSEPTLIKLAYVYKQATLHRQPTQFLPTADLLGAPGVPLPDTGGGPRYRGLVRPI